MTRGETSQIKNISDNSDKKYFRRTLKYYKEQLKFKSKRSRLLIMAISDKLNEKEVEIVKVSSSRNLEYFVHALK